MPKMENHAIFFSSLKGGAGKTTLSISLCVSEALKIAKKKKTIFEDIYYFDIDLFGSGSGYILGVEKGPYINTCRSFDIITQYYHPVKFSLEEVQNTYEASFLSSIIDPVLRVKKTYFGDTLNERINTLALDDILMDKLAQLLKKYQMDKKEGQLFGFDCSPGVDNFTQGVITKVKETGMKVSVLFASTYDMSHIQKLEGFFQNYTGTVPITDFNIKIILVDALNTQDLNKDDYNNYTNLVKEKLAGKTHIKNILQKAYDSRLIVANSYLRRAQLGSRDSTDPYLLDSDLGNQILK